ncbi:MAG: hypothetical protein IAF58_21625 [Leptolyngbya sp.]|nr:hypothetical protein [Candidatus Melainabacteria bacterium]
MAEKFPFELTQAMTGVFDCFYDIRALNGRCRAQHIYSAIDDHCNLDSLSLMVIEFSPVENAIKFMGDERERLQALGELLKSDVNCEEVLVSDQVDSKNSGRIYYSCRNNDLVFRVSLSYFDLNVQPTQFIDPIISALLEMHRNIAIKT